MQLSAYRGAQENAVLYDTEESEVDPAICRLWDELVQMADVAWSYRDPDSIRQLEKHLQRLKPIVAEEWQEPV